MLTRIGILILSFGLVSAMAIEGQVNLDADGQVGLQGNEAYDAGLGFTTGLNYGITDYTDLGVRFDYMRYQATDQTLASDFNEYTITAVNYWSPLGDGWKVKPKFGGHAGYSRFADADYLDVGLDGKVLFDINEYVDIYGSVIPTWLINEDQTDYLTKLDAGVQIPIPTGY